MPRRRLVVVVAVVACSLDLHDAFQGREICSKSTRQALLTQPPSGAASR